MTSDFKSQAVYKKLWFPQPCTAFPPCPSHTCLHSYLYTHTHSSFSKVFENNLQTWDSISPKYWCISPKQKHSPTEPSQEIDAIIQPIHSELCQMFYFSFLFSCQVSSASFNLDVFSFYVLATLNTGFPFCERTFQVGSSNVSSWAHSGHASSAGTQH